VPANEVHLELIVNADDGDSPVAFMADARPTRVDALGDGMKSRVVTGEIGRGVAERPPELIASSDSAAQFKLLFGKPMDRLILHGWSV